MAKKNYNNQNVINQVKTAIKFTAPVIKKDDDFTISQPVVKNQGKGTSTDEKPYIHQYLDASNVFSSRGNNYEERMEIYNSRRELADKFSLMSKEELKTAVKDMSDEELMRVYYASKAFQDRAYRMFGYKPGDKIPDDVQSKINTTIRLGIREGIIGEVVYYTSGSGESKHDSHVSHVYPGDEANSKKYGSVTAHEMSHEIYHEGAISPGYNTYYNKNKENNIYGKWNSAVNMLGERGADGTHDHAGVEQAADSAGLKIQLVREGLYNIFNPAPMTTDEYKNVYLRHGHNRLVEQIRNDFSKGAQIIGDIAMTSPSYNMEDLRSTTRNVLASLNDTPITVQSGNTALALASANFEAETQHEQRQNRGLKV